MATATSSAVRDAPWRRLAGVRRRRLQRLGIPRCLGQPPKLWTEDDLYDQAVPELQARLLGRRCPETPAERARRVGRTLDAQLEEVEECAACPAQVLCLLVNVGKRR